MVIKERLRKNHAKGNATSSSKKYKYALRSARKAASSIPVGEKVVSDNKNAPNQSTKSYIKTVSDKFSDCKVKKLENKLEMYKELVSSLMPDSSKRMKKQYNRDEKVLVYDENGDLFRAKITDIRNDKHLNVLRWAYKIHYLGWSNQCDEWVSLDRLIPDDVTVTRDTLLSTVKQLQNKEHELTKTKNQLMKLEKKYSDKNHEIEELNRNFTVLKETYANDLKKYNDNKNNEVEELNRNFTALKEKYVKDLETHNDLVIEAENIQELNHKLELKLESKESIIREFKKSELVNNKQNSCFETFI